MEIFLELLEDVYVLSRKEECIFCKGDSILMKTLLAFRASEFKFHGNEQRKDAWGLSP